MSNRPVVESDEVLNGFNPFATREPVVPTSSNTAPRPTFAAAVLPDTQQYGGGNTKDKAVRDIEERERALTELENKLEQREKELSKNEGNMAGVKINNFPPFPHCFPCKPCFYQDFDVDIADDYRGIVKVSFYVWLAYSCLLLVNAIGTLSYMIIKNADSDSGAMFGVSLAMFLLMPSLAFILCFRPLYRAFRSQSSINFFMFFLFDGILIIIVFIQVLGINVLGSCGWINSLILLKANVGVSIFMILIAIGFTAVLILSIFLYIKVHRTYRTTGASFDKAKAEMRNESVSAALHA